MAIEGVSGTGLEAQSSQTDAVKSLIRWESPHPLSIAGVDITRISLTSCPASRWNADRNSAILAAGVTIMSKASRPEFIESTAGQVSAELARRGVAPDQRVVVTIEPDDWITEARRASRAKVVAAGLS